MPTPPLGPRTRSGARRRSSSCCGCSPMARRPAPRDARDAVCPLRRGVSRAADPRCEAPQARPARGAGRVSGAGNRRTDVRADRRGPPPRSVIRFVAVGDLMVDVDRRGKGSRGTDRGRRRRLGAECGLLRGELGAEAAVAGRVGDDAAGRLLLSHLAARGVRAEVGIDASARTGTVLIVDGEIRADRGANSRFEPEHLRRSKRRSYWFPVTCRRRRSRRRWRKREATG